MENKFKQRLFDIIGLELYKTRNYADEISKHYNGNKYRLIWYTGSLTIYVQVRNKKQGEFEWVDVDVITLSSIPSESYVLEEMDLIMVNHLHSEREEWLGTGVLVSPYQDW